MRHVTIITAAGKEEIYCLDMDDTHEHEVWFTFKDQPQPRIFQRAAIISRQEHPPFDHKKWNEMARQANAIYDPENMYKAE